MCYWNTGLLCYNSKNWAEHFLVYCLCPDVAGTQPSAHSCPPYSLRPTAAGPPCPRGKAHHSSLLSRAGEFNRLLHQKLLSTCLAKKKVDYFGPCLAISSLCVSFVSQNVEGQEGCVLEPEVPMLHLSFPSPGINRGGRTYLLCSEKLNVLSEPSVVNNLDLPSFAPGFDLV